MKLPTLKRRKPIVYISLSIYALLSTFIIAESCIPGGLSSVQSGFFASISAFFINIFNGPKKVEVIKPSEFGEVIDTSYLGQGEDGYSNIVIGTTTLLSVEIKYPEKKKKDDTYDKTFTYEKVLGNSEDYNVVSSSHTNNDKFYVDLRVVANEMGSDIYGLNLNIGELTYEYKFHIVDYAKPTSFESRLNKTVLKIGETAQIETKLTGLDRNDYYLKRYFDISKIERSSSDDEIAYIDNYGVIHALKEGNVIIHYGDEEYPISVINETINNPIDNKITLTCNGEASLLDYDYVFDGDNNPNEYSVLVYASFDNVDLEDKSVSWDISNELSAKIAPYKYAEDGYPIYHDDNGNPCVRVCGYRKKGVVNLSCVSNVDSLIRKELEINVEEALPTSMNVNIPANLELIAGEQKSITATFEPKNVNNRNINVVSSNEKIIEVVNNNSTSPSLKSLKAGSAHIKVTSLANSELTYEFDVTVKAKQTINDDNFGDFHTFFRKFAGHFFLFLITGVFGAIFFYTYFEDKKYIFGSIAGLGIGLLLAGGSEFIQSFIPHRGANFLDVGIDFLGYFIGVLVTFIVFLIIDLIKKKKEK